MKSRCKHQTLGLFWVRLLVHKTKTDCGILKTYPENYFAFTCTLRYFLPENDKGIDRNQRIEVRASTRSKARELAAEFAYRHVVNNGLWLERLEESGIVPSLDDSINQLQELYQKKYVEKPEYCFVENHFNEWRCNLLTMQEGFLYQEGD